MFHPALRIRLSRLLRHCVCVLLRAFLRLPPLGFCQALCGPLTLTLIILFPPSGAAFDCVVLVRLMLVLVALFNGQFFIKNGMAYNFMIFLFVLFNVALVQQLLEPAEVTGGQALRLWVETMPVSSSSMS